MKHLENITIHRFRGLRDLTLQDLGEINLLVGVNNSGKTSVLEAISTYCCPLDLLAWLNTAWQREIKSSRKPQLEALKWLFPQNKDINQIDFYLGETYVSGEGNFAVKESRGFYEEIEALSLENPTTEEYLFDNLDFPQTVRGAKINLEAILKK
jgi:AAA15 family ATPase/GTPase